MGKVVCPDCSGLGVIFVALENGRRAQAACGHSVCLKAREDLIFERLSALTEARDSARGLGYANTDDLVRRVLTEVARHLPRTPNARPSGPGPGGR